jgi:hypothetical protein
MSHNTANTTANKEVGVQCTISAESYSFTLLILIIKMCGMLSVKDVSMVFETLLATPGMNDAVKISQKMTRKQILLLSKLVEVGLNNHQEEGKMSILSFADERTISELRAFSVELLKMAGLTEMNDRINTLLVKEK